MRHGSGSGRLAAFSTCLAAVLASLLGCVPGAAAIRIRGFATGCCRARFNHCRTGGTPRSYLLVSSSAIVSFAT